MITTTAASLGAILFATTINPSPSRADGLGDAVSKTLFPKQGFNQPATLQPGKVSMDQELLKDPKVIKGISELQAYRKKVDEIANAFKADPQMDLAKKVKDSFNIPSLRSALNVVNAVFDEDTQKETDRVVRNILQDINEVQTAAFVKPGLQRTAKKIEKTQGWLGQLGKHFDQLLSFY